jgi:hypothetical protein
MEVSNEGVSVLVHTMSLLAERGIDLSLDIYGPDEENDSGKVEIF